MLEVKSALICVGGESVDLGRFKYLHLAGMQIVESLLRAFHQ